MKSMKRLFVAALVAVLVGMPSLASPQRVIYTLCRYYDVEKNCYHCSDYFSVRSEEQAQRRCGEGTPYYFPSVGRLFGWMVGHCTCGDED